MIVATAPTTRTRSAGSAIVGTHRGRRSRKCRDLAAEGREETEWPRIVALYDALAALTGSPVVELNRRRGDEGVGPDAGLELLDSLSDEPSEPTQVPRRPG